MERPAASKYDGAAIALHWLVALGIIAAFVLIWALPGRNDPNRAMVLAFHKTAGVAVLAFALIRLVRRRLNPVAPYSQLTPLERRLSSITHVMLYVVMIWMPVTGYVFSTFEGEDLPIFNLITIPAVFPKNQPLGRRLEYLHVLAQWPIYVLVGLHVLGALYHRIVRRDGVLARMLPFEGQRSAGN